MAKFWKGARSLCQDFRRFDSIGKREAGVSHGRPPWLCLCGSLGRAQGSADNPLELIVELLIIGHMTASLFFPPLRQRARRHVAQRATILVRAAVERMQTALREQVEAADRLASEGDGLLRLIDGIVAALMAIVAMERTSIVFSEFSHSRLDWLKRTRDRRLWQWSIAE
jgi:hypothetical protein